MGYSPPRTRRQQRMVDMAWRSVLKNVLVAPHLQLAPDGGQFAAPRFQLHERNTTIRFTAEGGTTNG